MKKARPTAKSFFYRPVRQCAGIAPVGSLLAATLRARSAQAPTLQDSAALPLQQLHELRLVDDRHAELLRLVEFRTRLGAGQHVAGLLADTAADLAAGGLDFRAGLVARHGRQRAGEHEGLPGK